MAEPVTIGSFVNEEAADVAEALRVLFGHDPVPSDLYFQAWRRLREGWTHQAILDGIYGQLPTPPPARRPIVGTARIETSAYIDASGPFIPIMCHFGDALARLSRGHQAEVHALLVEIARHYQGIRVWAVLEPNHHDGYWQGMDIGPWRGNYRDAILILQSWCAELGLKIQWSLGDLWWLGFELRNEVRAQLRQHLDAGTLFSIDGGNECFTNGGPPADIVAEWLAPLAAQFPHIVTLSQPPTGSTGDEHHAFRRAWSASPSTHYEHHIVGANEMGHVRRHFNEGYDSPPRSVGCASEPRGPGQRVSVKRVADVNVLQLMALGAAISGQGYTYFCGAGIRSDEIESLPSQPGFREVPAILASLPQDIARWTRMHGGGATWADQRVFRVPDGNLTCRVDQAVAPDGRFVAIAYDQGWQGYVQERPATITRTVDFGHWGRLIAGTVQG